MVQESLISLKYRQKLILSLLLFTITSIIEITLVTPSSLKNITSTALHSHEDESNVFSLKLCNPGCSLLISHHCWEGRSSCLGWVISNPGEQTPAPLTPHKWAPHTLISFRALPWLTAALLAIALPHSGCWEGSSAFVYKAWRQEDLYRTKLASQSQRDHICLPWQSHSQPVESSSHLYTFINQISINRPLAPLSVHLCQW